MTKYDKELQTGTREHEKAIEPLDRLTHRQKGSEKVEAQEADEKEGKREPETGRLHPGD